MEACVFSVIGALTRCRMGRNAMHAVVSKQFAGFMQVDCHLEIVCKLAVDLPKLMLMFVDGASHVRPCSVLFCLSVL